MKKRHFMGLLLAALLLGAQSLLALTCNGSVTATASDSRYTDNPDGTVTDNTSGLMWQKCSLGLSGSDCLTGAAQGYTWQSALAAANSNSDSGYSDWRLPNRNELASLVENSCYNPAINMTTFPNTVASNYWSASPNASSSYYAWYVYFGHGNVSYDVKGNAFYVRLVRGGQ